MAAPTLADPAFLDLLRTTTETRWADTGLRDATTAGLGGPTWQPGTRWRGGMSVSDLEIVEAMFGVRLPRAYRLFLLTLHTPDPPLAALALRGGRMVRVEQRLFPDWTGPTTPLLAAFEAPLAGLLQGVAIGRWHPTWGDRPDDAREQLRRVRGLAGAGPRLIPFAGHRYFVAEPGCDDGPVIAVHGANMTVIAPDLASGLLRELGLGEGLGVTASSDATAAGQPRSADQPAAAEAPTPLPATASSAQVRIPFWSDIADGLPWGPPGATARA